MGMENIRGERTSLVSWNHVGYMWEMNFEAKDIDSVKKHVTKRMQEICLDTSRFFSNYYIPKSVAPIVKVFEEDTNDWMCVQAVWHFVPNNPLYS